MSSENTPDPPGRSGPEDTIQALREKARSALSDAEVLLVCLNQSSSLSISEAAARKCSRSPIVLAALGERGSPEATINRGYYAVFQAARAALLTEGERPDPHSGVIRRFGSHFVRTERVSEEIGGILTTAQSMRGEADKRASDLCRRNLRGPPASS